MIIATIQRQQIHVTNWIRRFKGTIGANDAIIVCWIVNRVFSCYFQLYEFYTLNRQETKGNGKHHNHSSTATSIAAATATVFAASSAFASDGFFSDLIHG